MSNPSLIAKLGLDASEFSIGINASEESLEQLQTTAKVTAAEIAFLEREMQGGGTEAQQKAHNKLQASLRQTQAEAKATQRQLAAMRAVDSDGGQAPGRASGGGGNGGGAHAPGTRMAGMEAGHSVRSVVDMLGAGQNLDQALQMELPRMLQAAGIGIGGMIATELGTAIARGLESSIQGGALEKQKFGRELAGAGGGVGTSTSEALKSQIEALQKSEDERLDATGNGAAGNDGNIFSWMARKGKDLFRKAKDLHAPTVEQETDNKIVALDERRQQISEEIARRKGEEVALDQRAAKEGEEAVAADRERLALRERIAAVQGNTSLDGKAQAEIIAGLREESRLRQEHITQIKTQREAEREAAHGNAEDRQKGLDTTVTKAQHGYDEATAKLASLVPGTPEWEAARTDLTNKGSDLRDARENEAARKARLSDQGAVAGMTGTEAEKRRRQLADEKKLLNDQLNPFSDKYQSNAEKREEIIARDLPQNEAATRALDRDEQQRRFQRRKNEIAANTGRGPDAQVRAIEDRLSLNQDEQADNATHENSLDRASQLKSEAAELKRQKSDIVYAEKQALAAATAQTTEMELQITGQDSASKLASIRAQYEAEIADALRNQNTELAHQKEAQRDIALDAAGLAEFRKTGDQRASDRLAQQKDEQDLKTMHGQQRRKLANDRQRYEDENRSQLPLDADARRKIVEEAVPDTIRKDGSSTAKEARENATDADFQRRFHPDDVPNLPSRIPDIKAGAETAGKPAGGFNDSNIVSGLRDVVTAVKGVSFKNNKR